MSNQGGNVKAFFRRLGGEALAATGYKEWPEYGVLTEREKDLVDQLLEGEPVALMITAGEHGGP